MEDFSSTGQLVTLGLVDSSIGAMAKGCALVDVEALIAKELLSSSLLIGHPMCPSKYRATPSWASRARRGLLEAHAHWSCTVSTIMGFSLKKDRMDRMDRYVFQLE